MPLKLIAPKPGRSSSYRIRGTYLGIYLDRSTGTRDRKTATAILDHERRKLERQAATGEKPVSFQDAAVAYKLAEGEARYLEKLMRWFANKSIYEIDQVALDNCASAIYPKANAATRNRQVYSPVSAVLKHAGVTRRFKRPKGARGVQRTHWLQPDEVFALVKAAEKAKKPRMGALIVFLTYTGVRLNEALALEWPDVDLSRSYAYLRMTKNGEPQAVHLPPVVVAALANLTEKKEGRLFRMTKCGRIYTWLDEIATAAKVPIPERVAFHVFRHTFGAWCRRFGGLDTAGLVATGRWRSRQAAAVYEHVDVTEEARKSDLFPTQKKA